VIVTNSQQTLIARHFPMAAAVISYQHSPTQTSELSMAWPVTQTDWWCGEFKAVTGAVPVRKKKREP
jgi:hypothetical protein